MAGYKTQKLFRLAVQHSMEVFKEYPDLKLTLDPTTCITNMYCLFTKERAQDFVVIIDKESKHVTLSDKYTGNIIIQRTLTQDCLDIFYPEDKIKREQCEGQLSLEDIDLGR